MMRRMLRSKIHRATITQADLNYEGSLTIPPELMEAAGLMPYEAIWVWNVTRGSRLETYAITGLPDSKDICINGAAAHLNKPGDLVIVACFANYSEAELVDFKPTLVFVDEHNCILSQTTEIPGPQHRTSPIVAGDP